MKNQIILSLAIGSLLISCSPTDYTIVHSTEIDAPPEAVFAYVNNHKMRDFWSPWEAMDPNMVKSYEGPEAGVGAIYKWKGNDSVGTGSMEILESQAPGFIKSKLIFTDPWESESIINWNFEPNGEGTKATWTIAGQLPGYLFWMGQEDMEEAMGADFERGLKNLKAVVEEATPKSPYTVEVIEVATMDYVFIRETIATSAVDSSFFADRYARIAAALGDDMKNMTGAPFAIYHRWDMDAQVAEVSVAMPCTTKKSLPKGMASGKTYDGNVIKVDHYGSYEETANAHLFMEKYTKDNGLDIIESPWEVYVTDPATESDPSKWLTQVYYPVRKMEQM